MSLRIPLAVRLSTARADRHVTQDLRSLSFRSVAPGGFASCSLSLDRPLAYDAPEIAAFGRVYVYDGRSGATVWEGWQEDPGKGASGDGQVWEVSALGPQSRASDVKAPWIYFDKSLERFSRTPGADVETHTEVESGDGVDDSLVRLSIAGGTTISTNNYFGMTYTGLYYTGQKLARYAFSWDGYGPEIAGVDYFAKVSAYTSPLQSSGSDANFSGQLSTSPGTGGPYIITTHITAGRTVVTMFINVGGGAHAAPAGMRMRILDFYVLGTRYLRDGTESTAAATYNAASPNILQAHQVVEDVLGRLLPTFDGPNASIATNSYNIDQLAYVDGATAAEILADLMQLEPAYYWAAWESPPLVAGGRSRFEWRQWPSTVRYEATVDDGYSAPGSGVDLFSSVIVRWVDVVGRSRQRVRTQTVQLLTDAGISRQELLDLGSSMGSDNNAIQAGDGFLADHAAPANGGTLTVSRRILDRDAGRMVDPWEIRPGHLIRINGLSARSDALLATGPDGRSVFRVAATEYSTDSATATLELDTWPRNVAQAVARLKKQQATTRRR